MKRSIVVIGTRGSPLALAQTKIVLNELRRKTQRKENLDFRVREIKTAGDKFQKKALTGKDSFTREIDRALAAGEIDLAVHSLKDVPLSGSSQARIEIGAFPKRDSPYDVLVAKRAGETISTLPKNARIGTSSVRRAVQLKSFRPDFEIVEIRGNVQTRIEKLRRKSDLDAIILAKAGLKRLRLFKTGELIPRTIMLPAIGQGCLAVSVRKNDSAIKKLVSRIDDKTTRQAVTAERAFSAELGGGCNTPIAALATISRNRPKKLVLQGMVAIERPPSRPLIIRSSIFGNPREARALGRALARRLKKGVVA
jgi:hydroxymethylbilane synthase